MEPILGRPTGPHIYFDGRYWHKPEWWDTRELVVPYVDERRVPKEIDLIMPQFGPGDFKTYLEYRQYRLKVEEASLSPTPPFIIKKDDEYLFSEARYREAFAKRNLRYYETPELGERKTKSGR